jgi:CBS domain-containing protein
MKVGDVMCRPVTSCTEETNVSSAGRMMGENDCGFLPVLRARRIVGVVTDRDICVAIGKKRRSPSELLVREIMSKDVASCATTDAVGSALSTMALRQVRRLPVLDPKGALVGILSLDDLVLRAEEQSPTGAPASLSFGDVIRALRRIVGTRPLRKSA